LPSPAQPGEQSASHFTRHGAGFVQSENGIGSPPPLRARARISVAHATPRLYHSQSLTVLPETRFSADVHPADPQSPRQTRSPVGLSLKKSSPPRRMSTSSLATVTARAMREGLIFTLAPTSVAAGSSAAVTLVPGLNTVRLIGAATVSGIFSPSELVLDSGAVRLSGSSLPQRVFRVHASPQLHVAVSPEQPPLFAGTRDRQRVQVIVDCGRYQLVDGTLTLTCAPDLALNAQHVGGCTDANSVQLPLTVATTAPDRSVALVDVWVQQGGLESVTSASHAVGFALDCALESVAGRHQLKGTLNLKFVCFFGSGLIN
jgi:hypothetical protein